MALASLRLEELVDTVSVFLAVEISERDPGLVNVVGWIDRWCHEATPPPVSLPIGREIDGETAAETVLVVLLIRAARRRTS